VLGAAAGEGVLARDIGALERYLSVGSPSEEAGGGRPPERFTLATCERTLKEFGSVISWYRQEVAAATRASRRSAAA